MSIFITALALTASAQAAPATPEPVAQPGTQAQHHQMAPNQKADGCACCKDMAAGKKMACCEKHEKAGDGDHAGHSSQ